MPIQTGRKSGVWEMFLQRLYVEIKLYATKCCIEFDINVTKSVYHQLFKQANFLQSEKQPLLFCWQRLF
jgi:hypothetical protein